jgi:dihydroflavonol-4-reductase
VIVNPTIILGAGNWENGSTGIFKSVYNEFPWYTEGTTGFVDVADVARAMIMLMESDLNAERFILSAENWSYRKLFDSIADAFHKKRPAKNVTPAIAAIVWRWEALKSKFTGKAPLVTKETALTALAKTQYDNSKLKKSLPAFHYTPLQETVVSTCKALQQKLNIH